MDIRYIEKKAEPIYHEGNRIGIIMLHGFASAPDVFNDLKEDLILSGYTLYIPLLSGHGDHPSVLKGVSYHDWLNDAEQAYQKINQNCTQIFVIGVSLGATLALHLSAQYDNIIGTLIANPLISLPGIEKFYNEIESLDLEYLSRMEPPHKNKIKDNFYYDKYPLSAYSEILKLSPYVFRHLDQIKAAMLLFSSVADTITSSIKVGNAVLSQVNSHIKMMINLYGASYHQSFDDNDRIIMRQISHDFIRYQIEQFSVNQPIKRRKLIRTLMPDIFNISAKRRPY